MQYASSYSKLMDARGVFEFLCKTLSGDTLLFLHQRNFFVYITRGRIYYIGYFTLAGDFMVCVRHKGFLRFGRSLQPYLFYKEDLLKRMSEKDGKGMFVIYCDELPPSRKAMDPLMVPIRMEEVCE